MPVHPSFKSIKNFGAEEKSVFLVYRKINRNKCVLEKQNPAFEDLVTAGGCSWGSNCGRKEEERQTWLFTENFLG